MQKKAWLFHFESIYDLVKCNYFIETLQSLKQFGPFEICIEDQLVKRNCILEGFITGVFSFILDVKKIYSLPPKLKYSFSEKYFNFLYKKTTSNLKYENLPYDFKRFCEEWVVFEIKSSVKTEMNFKNYKCFKKDDLIDCFLFSIIILIHRRDFFNLNKTF